MAEVQKRALVTGGAGLIGSHLCDQLLAEGYEVIVLDNLQIGSKKNIEHLLGNPKFTFIEHDVTEPISIEGDIHEIYNLACPASPAYFQKNPIHIARTCFLGVYNMLELARTKNARLLQASTSEVYGDPEEHPQKESYRGSVNTMGPRACYDEGKRVAETLCADFKRMHGVVVKVIRIFNTYGPRLAVEDGRVVSNFIIQALKNEPITVYGDGSQTRSFCYVSDMVRGIRAMMKSKDDILGPINIGNPDEYTVKVFAELIKNITASDSEIIYLDLPEDDPARRRPDITKAKELLDWAPEVSLQDGLQSTITYFKNAL